MPMSALCLRVLAGLLSYRLPDNGNCVHALFWALPPAGSVPSRFDSRERRVSGRCASASWAAVWSGRCWRRVGEIRRRTALPSSEVRRGTASVAGKLTRVVGRNATPGGVGPEALPAVEQPQRNDRLRRAPRHCCIEAKTVFAMHRAGRLDLSGTLENHNKPDI